MFKFTEFGKKSGSIIHKKYIQKAFHQKYLTTKITVKKLFIKNILP